MKPTFLFLIAFLLSAVPAFAQEVGTCETGRAESYLDINNVRARILNNGALFWSGEPRVYEVPKGGGVHAIYTSSLWVGGMVDGELRLSGATYRPGEFWPGPLTDTGTLPDSNDCSPYDRLYNVSLRDLLVYEQLGILTDDLRDWPWQHGAPVKDGDGNPYNYNLSGGDRPDIPGHQGIWWIMNDLGNAHTRTKGIPIGLEVQAMAFAGASRIDAINDATIYRYRLVNKGAKPVEDTYVGFHVAPGLGAFYDDYAGSDTTYGLAYVYNADNLDDGNYGESPPALGYKVLQGPLVDGDGKDNNHDGVVDEWAERLGMTSFLYYNSGGGTRGDPRVAQDYYNYMQAKWRDGSPMTEGRHGYGFSEKIISYWMPGDPVTKAFWSEFNIDGQGIANPPREQRFVLSTGPFTIPAGGEQEIVIAILWARGADHLDSITQLREASIIVQQAYDYGYDIALPEGQAPADRSAYLVPADGATGQPTNTRLTWGAIEGAEAYLLQVAQDPGFRDVLLTTLVEEPQQAVDLSEGNHYYWRVAAVNLHGAGPFSEVQAFTVGGVQYSAGAVHTLQDGTPAFVEVAVPGGGDPCAVDPADKGCVEVGGYAVQDRLNSTGAFVMTHPFNLGDTGDVIGKYAPNEFEVRFTKEGSFAAHIFTSGVVIQVPLEVWDIGETPPFSENDPSDDVRLIPVIFSENDGECEWAYGDRADYSGRGGNGYTDRLYAYYPVTTYAEWEEVARPLVEADAAGCPASPITHGALIMIDYDSRRPMRPIQRVVFKDNTGDPLVKHPPVGTVIRFYTTATGVMAPIPSSPKNDALADGPLVALWWQEPPDGATYRVQVAEDAAFANILQDEVVGAPPFRVQGISAGVPHYWRVQAANDYGRTGPWSEAWSFQVAMRTGVEEEQPFAFRLEQNYPNPFNPATVIRFMLPQAGPARLTVYDVLGREVTRLVDEVLPSGVHEAVWRAQGTASGLYVYRLEAGTHRAERKMLLVR